MLYKYITFNKMYLKTIYAFNTLSISNVLFKTVFNLIYF